MKLSAVRACTLLCGAAWTLTAFAQIYEHNLPRDHPAIQYSRTASADPIARLAAALESGTATLTADADGGVLPDLLRRLDINTDSQLLVFSKTSLQHPRISPRNPRAIYFNDDLAVAVVRGAEVVELAASTPTQGAVFYTLEGAARGGVRIVRRDGACLRCHQGVATAGVPGLMVTSVFPSASGTPDISGGIVTDHRTPFGERWGGLFVTGTHGRMRHRGNAVASNPAEPAALDADGTLNVTDLRTRFDPKGYLTPYSDIVALMTYEHQTQMMNLLTRLNWEARLAAAGMDAVRARLDARLEEVVRYMVFADEPALEAPVAGVSGFARTFPARGPRDRRGRSLRDFDLQRRVFRYPLSYAIYSPAVAALPDGVRTRLFSRLLTVLNGKGGPAYARLSDADRTAVLEILRETKADVLSAR